MADPHARRLLVVDDDAVFRQRIALALQRRGYETCAAGSVGEAIGIAADFAPQLALIDLKMPGGNGLDLVAALKAALPGIRMVVLTGYGSIASALEAVRLGAADYLTKPADADQIAAALAGRAKPAELSAPSLDRVEWEHLQRVLADCGQNISQAARVLGIDRRSLQRKLNKIPPAT
jgi:two-component system response regulator RegA